MLNTIYATRIGKNKIWKEALIYWFRRIKDYKLIGIVSYGHLKTKDTVALYTKIKHRYLGDIYKLDKKPVKTTGAIYYVCD